MRGCEDARKRGRILLCAPSIAATASCYLVLPIRQIVLPQSGHSPFVMGLPFFVVLATGFFIAFFVLHFMQYASIVPAFPFVIISIPSCSPDYPSPSIWLSRS